MHRTHNLPTLQCTNAAVTKTTAGEINFHVTVPLIRNEDVQAFRKAVGME